MYNSDLNGSFSEQSASFPGSEPPSNAFFLIISISAGVSTGPPPLRLDSPIPSPYLRIPLFKFDEGDTV